ncbi:MAG: right-handed parallel beta-helix repeat-containing protein [Candidatus Cloacimonetes bacterium]|nr:right-handed parallel beta-helix repeat-containing protein [Candidatus Cloacimonadota bacterium]
MSKKVYCLFVVILLLITLSVFAADNFKGDCLDFDGSNDYISIPSDASLNNPQFTVEFWVSLDNPGNWDGIIDKGENTSSDWFFVTGNSGQTQGVIFGIGNGSSKSEKSYSWNDALWHHVAGTYDGTNFKLYVDGDLKGTNAFSYSNTSNNIVIGGRRSLSWFSDSKLDEVSIWNDARTEEEINQDMHYYLNGSEAGLVSYYQFNEGTGTTTNDLTSGNNGTLHNMDNADWVTSNIPLYNGVQGTISSNTTWSDDFIYVSGDVTVNDNVTLTINPGTVVSFYENYKLNIDGRILAVGTEADSIKFTADPSTGWHGLRFDNTSTGNDSSKVVYCILENGDATGSGDDSDGGAVFIKVFPKIRIDKCSFRNNTAASDGGAIFIDWSDCKVLNSSFTGNSASNGGAAYFYAWSGVSFWNNILTNNSANHGGGIDSYSATPDIRYCTIQNNTASAGGGGIKFQSESAVLINCLITDNDADDGGGILTSGCDLTVTNCTVANNTANTGGGYSDWNSESQIKNSIFYDNQATTGAEVCLNQTDSDPNFYYCNIAGGQAGFEGTGAGANYTEDYVNCIDADPEFTGISDFTLTSISSCLNGGDPSTTTGQAGNYDLAGNNRFFNSSIAQQELNTAFDRIDIGVYEYSSETAAIPHGVTISNNHTLSFDLYVANGVTVTIAAGTTIEFDAGYGFNICGNLEAIGDSDNFITFTASNHTNGWKGLNFISTTAKHPSSNLEYCIIEYGKGDVSKDERYGGNIYLFYYEEILIQNSIIRNGYGVKGGAICADRTHLILQGSLLYDNVGSSHSGALYSYDSDVSIINCTIVDNSASTFGALVFSSIEAHELEIINCIIRDNGTDPISPVTGTSVDVSYCNIDFTYEGTNNISTDPEFVGTGDHPYNIKSYSYCINAGIPNVTGLNLPEFDLLGNSRIFSIYSVDIGAYEYQGLFTPHNFIASNGDSAYPGYVQLAWDYNPNYEPSPVNFRIFRDGVSINLIDSQTFTYADYTATPGQVYSYYVQASADGLTGNSAEDSGYIKPNGIISGTILTANNNPVQGVKVSIEPSPGYCLEFDSSNPSELVTEDPEVDMDNDFTIEFWVRTLLSDVILLNKGDHNFSINASGEVEYTDGTNTLVQTNGAINVNDNAWHHLALVNDFTTTNTILYLDDIVIAEQSVYTFGGSSDSGFSTNSSFTGFIDDIRIWSTARDSSEIVEGMDIVTAVDEVGLMGYWPLNEGNGNYIFDATDYSHNGSLVDCDWSVNGPDMLLGAFTDGWGEYIIRQINYGASTTFAVTPFKSGHIFQPEQRNVTLSTSNIAQNAVDFIDNSMIPISGQVLFQSTDCPVVGATILLNGEIATPLTITDEDGNYILEVEHGTNCIISVDYSNHIFNREWHLGEVTFPQSNINFEDTFKAEFRLEVVGGNDSYPIGEFDVTLQSVNGCYIEVITGSSWSTGGINITNLPPLDFNVTVDPVDGADPFALAIDEQFQNMKTDIISLTHPDSTLDTLSFVWKAPLNISVAWSDTLSLYHFPEYPESEFYVLPQNEWCEVEVQTFEDYSWDGHPDQMTYLDDCELTIIDEVGTSGTTDTAFEDTTVFVYRFAPYTPSMLTGYARQYQKLLEFTARDNELNRFASQADYVFIEGIKPQESTYATTSPELPFLILHDPPGDGSSSSFSESSSISLGFGASVSTNIEQSIFQKAHLGHKIDFSTGCAAFSVEHEYETTADYNNGLTLSLGQSVSLAQKLTFTTTQGYSTSSADQIIGAGSDVFVGGAVNLIWGITKELSWDIENQEAVIDTSLMVTPDGFDTVYMYSDAQIRLTVIPNLYAIGDTTSAELWQSYLDKNEYNKANAEPNPNHVENLSFNAGAGYTFSEQTNSNSNISVDFFVSVSNEFGAEFGSKIDGFGYSGGYKFKASIKIGASASVDYSTTTTTSFTLADDDETSSLNFIADYFSVDIKKDPVYGTPVFDLVSGATSCHWEPNTMPRDGVSFSANTYTASNLLEEQEAAFILQLGNTSQTDEARRYNLHIKQGSNPGGAIIKINGVLLEGSMPFDVPAGETVQAIMTVAQGPFAYEYEDLKLRFFSPCNVGYPGPDGHYFDIYRYFDIYWEAPYSRISIDTPADDWIINQANDDTLDILLRDYDLSKPDFASIKLQYKHPQDENWLPAFEIFRDSLFSHPHYIEVPWDVSGIPDGFYEIRAATTDSVQADYYTEALSGVIDRISPEVMGVPEPADDILEPGDEISVTFAEDINCTDVNPNDITVTITSTSQQIDFDVDCYENTIEIVPSIANFWFENETLEVEISELEDLYGNVLESPISWEFYVNSNPVNWNVTKLDVIKPLGESMILTANLINDGGQHYSYVFTDYADSLYHSELQYHAPDWLSITPTSGQLIPLDGQEISFEISDQIGFGHYETLIYAHTPMGNEAIEIEVDVLSNPPNWSVTEFINFQSSMSIIGEVNIEGDISDDSNDIIGAFIENGSGEWACRGVANVESASYISGYPYQVFLTIYSDLADPVRAEDEIRFKVWDNSDNKEYYQIDHSVFGGTLMYLANEIYGTPMNPINLQTVSDMVQDIPLNSGWTWFSTNLNLVPNTINDVLSSLNPIDDDFIKDQQQYSIYSTDQWLGSLTIMNNTSMYKINVENTQNLEIIGELRNPVSTPISYDLGWDWIGYIPHVSMSVNQAMSDRTNVTGDFIKNQAGYAFYVDSSNGWMGSLRFMNPGDGFMLCSSDSGSFDYPEYNIRGKENYPEFIPIALRDAPDWSVIPRNFEYTASITTELQFNGIPAETGNYMIGAFAGEECRGTATPIAVNDTYLYFLTVYSNTNNEEIEFKVYSVDDDEIIIPENSIQFANDLILGSPSSPYEMNVLGLLGIPQNITIEVIGTDVQLSWEAVSGANSYKIFSSEDPNGTFVDVSHLGTFSEMSWSTLIIDSRKFYYVVASMEVMRDIVNYKKNNISKNPKEIYRTSD